MFGIFLDAMGFGILGIIMFILIIAALFFLGFILWKGTEAFFDWFERFTTIPDDEEEC